MNLREMPLSLPDPRKIILRVSLEDSAYVYAILEACDGLCTLSTRSKTERSCDLELQLGLGREEEAEKILGQILKELRGEGFVLPESAV